MRKKNIIIALVFIVLAGVILNLDVSIRQGVDGKYSYVHMPLYVKWTQFLARHYEYVRLSKEITKGCKNDEEKTIAILDWTHTHLKDVPKCMPHCDDHMLNIIIRGYGEPEQFQDIFTVLCSYSGIPAHWSRIRDKQGKARYTISFALIYGKWRVFDAYYGKYFRTSSGEIASIDDILKDRSILEGKGIDAIMIHGVPYKEFYYNMKPIKDKPAVTRANKQMPLQRFIFEIKKLFGMVKEDPYLV